MAIANVKRWVWIVIGLLVGLGFDQIQRLPRNDWMEAYGRGLNQREFEDALRAPAASRPFRNLVVYREMVGDLGGTSKPVYIVAGDWTNRAAKGGLERRCFIAEMPYRTIRGRAGPSRTMDSVVSYLDTLRKVDGTIGYRHAWWRGTRAATALWAGLGVLVIGIVWPSIINLIVFKRLLRPAEAKGISLLGVKGSTDQPATGEKMTDQDVEKTKELVEKIEAELSVDALPRGEEPSAPVAPAAVVALSGGPVEAAARASGEQASKEFGRDQDDFYPTEVHAHPHKEAGKAKHGFTLVELLVVIGIIALLLGLLLPALSGFRQRAREVQCQSTLRNIGFAGQLHLNDHRGRLPLAGWQFNPIGGVVNPAGVGDSEEKYYTYYTDAGVRRPVPITVALAMSMGVKFRLESRDALNVDMQRERVKDLFRCWSQEPQGRAGSMGDGTGWGPPPEWSSYIYNEALLARRNQKWEWPQGHMSKVKRPGAVMFAMDGHPRTFLALFDMNQHYTIWDFHLLALVEAARHGPDPVDYLRHRYRANVLFLDWHVESVPLTENGQKSIGISNGIYD